MSVLTPRINDIDTRIDNKDVKNVIINGGFDFWQRGTSFTAPATGEYLCDRFRTYYFGIVPNITREEDVPSWSNSKYSAKVGINTAIASPTTNDFLNFRQLIEGNFFKHLIGKDIIISFSVKSNKAGQHGMYLYTTENSQASYNTSYTINQADTWERKKVKIPAAVGFEDTFGTDTGTSLAVLWLMTDTEAVPSAVDTWEAGLTNAGNNSNVQVGTDISDYWQISDIMLIEDTGEPDFDPEFQRAGRNYQEEELLCLRYCYQRDVVQVNDHVALYRDFGSPGGSSTWFLPVPLRDDPVITYTCTLGARTTTSSTNITSLTPRHIGAAQASFVTCYCTLQAEISGALGVVETLGPGGYIRFDSEL